LFTKIVFEINITSNEYLLGQALREGDRQQTIRLNSLTDLDVPIILATDDDGIWPIDHCLSKHPGHQSLVAEYCRAFSLSLITVPQDLRKMLKNTKDACFYSCDGVYLPSDNTNEHDVLTNDDKNASTIVFHPDLIKTVLQKYSDKNYTCSRIFKYYSKLYPTNCVALSNINPTWKRKCNSLASFVFISYYNNEPGTILDSYRDEYSTIFGDNPSLDKIYEIWLNVWNRFMDLNDKTISNHISTDLNGPVFLSESSDDNQKDLSYLSDELDHNHFRERDIRVFTRQVSKPLETIEMLNKMLQKPCSAKSITVFTTKNKDEYVDSAKPERRRLVINEKPTQRTNYHGVQEEHVLYVICRHASAATAYLHYIGSEIANQNQQTFPNLNTQPSVTSSVQERSPETDLSANIGCETKELI
jgi:hypothetical protein